MKREAFIMKNKKVWFIVILSAVLAGGLAWMMLKPYKTTTPKYEEEEIKEEVVVEPEQIVQTQNEEMQVKDEAQPAEKTTTPATVASKKQVTKSKAETPMPQTTEATTIEDSIVQTVNAEPEKVISVMQESNNVIVVLRELSFKSKAKYLFK
jgi:hypothetical protein